MCGHHSKHDGAGAGRRSGPLHLDPGAAKAFTRREFAQGALAFASASAFVPTFLQNSAMAMPRAGEGLSSIAGVDEGRVLVVIQLSGGNDGLNMVAPHGLDEYRRARPGMGLRAEDCLALEKKWPGLGLHKSMTGVKDLYDEGLCSIVQGVGYPNPNRSHFTSMDIWHTANTDGTGTGWLGRYFDSQCPNDGGRGRDAAGLTKESAGAPGVAMGGASPLAMQGGRVQPVSFTSADLYRWVGGDGRPGLDERVAGALEKSAPSGKDGSNLAFLNRTAVDARVSSERVRKAVGRKPLVNYPRTPLGRQLQMVASMVRAGMPTRVYYTVHGGFDTHASQGGAQGRHANLLKQLGDAVKAFYGDLRAQENDSRVLTLTFSEFGRRVEQNASGGTDHGTAAPLMLFGPMVNAGVRGSHPSMTKLDNGDLIHTTDFRRVYAAILEKWLSTDSRAVLGDRFKSMNVLKV